MSGDVAGDGGLQELPKFSQEKQQMLERVREKGLALEGASDELQADRDVVLAAVRQNGRALAYANDELRADREVVMEAMTQNAWSLRSASDKWDRMMPDELVYHKCRALLFASDELKADKEVVMKAVRQDGRALKYAVDELKADKEVVMEAVKQDGGALRYADEVLRTNRDVVMAAVKKSGGALEYAGLELRADNSFMAEVVKQSGLTLQYASVEIRDDRCIVVEAVKQDVVALRYTSPQLQADKDLILLAARSCDDMGNIFLSRGAKAIWDQEGLSEAKKWPIAVQGEDAPIVTISLSRKINEAGEAAFSCEACLMSGQSITCLIQDLPKNDRWGNERPHPILDHLAGALLADLQSQSEASAPERVFINFIINSEDGDEDGGVVMPVTPWDWNRPLSDFLATPAPAQTQSAFQSGDEQCCRAMST